jgi:hypothetical protein
VHAQQTWLSYLDGSFPIPVASIGDAAKLFGRRAPGEPEQAWVLQDRDGAVAPIAIKRLRVTRAGSVRVEAP